MQSLPEWEGFFLAFSHWPLAITYPLRFARPPNLGGQFCFCKMSQCVTYPPNLSVKGASRYAFAFAKCPNVLPTPAPPPVRGLRSLRSTKYPIYSSPKLGEVAESQRGLLSLNSPLSTINSFLCSIKNKFLNL